MLNTKEVYAFIDSQNLNLAISAQEWKLDFKRFRTYLKDKYGVTRAFLFIGYVATNQNLYISLQECGYILVFKPTLQLPSGKVKGVEYLNKQDKLLKLLVPNQFAFSSLFRKFREKIDFMNGLKVKLEHK